MRSYYCLLFFGLLIFGIAGAQNLAVTSKLYTVSDGLVSRNVRAVEQDKTGILWIATDLGLVIYDGVSIHSPDFLPDSIRNARFDRIDRALDGVLWFSKNDLEYDELTNQNVLSDTYTYDAGNENSKNAFQRVTSGPMSNLNKKSDGSLWMWNVKNEIYRYGHELELVLNAPTKGLCSVQQTKTGLFLFYNDRIVQVVEGRTYHEIPLKYTVKDTYLAANGNIYFLNTFGTASKPKNTPIVGRFNPIDFSLKYGSKKYERSRNAQFPFPKIRDNGQEDFLVFFENNAYRFNPESLEIEWAAKILDSELEIWINSMGASGKNQYWFSTTEGLLLAEIRASKVQNYLGNQSISIRGIAELNSEELFVASYSGNKIVNISTNQTKDADFNNWTLFGLEEFSNEFLIAGDYTSNYYLINKTDQTEHKYSSGAKSNTLVPLRISTGDLWFCTLEGPYLYHEGDQQFYMPKPIANSPLGEQEIRSISHQKGQYYFASANGLFISGNDFVPILDTVVKKQFVTDVLVTDHEYWVSTFGNGLYKINNQTKKVTIYNAASAAFLNDFIYLIHDDGFGFLWLPTNNGLIRFEKSTGASVVFLQSNGFANYEYNNASFWEAENGRIFLGGIDGLSSFHPKDFLEDRDTLEVQIANMQYREDDGSIVGLADWVEGEAIELPTNYLTLSMDLYTSNYALNHDIDYFYRIPNYTNDWIAIENKQLRLNRLPFGNHKLEIKAFANGLRWFPISTLDLNVDAPFYYQGVFILLLVLGLIAAASFYTYWRTDQLRKRNIILSTEVKHRTKELSSRNAELIELNDTRDRLFGIIAHDLRGPLIGFKDLGKKIEFLKKQNREEDLDQLTANVQDNYENLTGLLDNLLHWISAQRGRLPIKIESINLNEHIDETLRLYDHMIRQKQIRIIREGPPVELLADSDALDILLRNLINNALKYSEPNGKVWISSFENMSEVSLVIEDEGVGMSAQELSTIFQVNARRGRQGTQGEKSTGLGLPLCKEFIDLMDGRIEVKSELEKGTRIVVSLPNSRYANRHAAPVSN